MNSGLCMSLPTTKGWVQGIFKFENHGQPPRSNFQKFDTLTRTLRPEIDCESKSEEVWNCKDSWFAELNVAIQSNFTKFPILRITANCPGQIFRNSILWPGPSAQKLVVSQRVKGLPFPLYSLFSFIKSRTLQNNTILINYKVPHSENHGQLPRSNFWKFDTLTWSLLGKTQNTPFSTCSDCSANCSECAPIHPHYFAI